MQKLFPTPREARQPDQTQSRLMILAALMVVSFALILSLAPNIRNAEDLTNFHFDHWLGVAIWLAAFSFLHFITTRKLSKRDPFLLPLFAFLSGMGLMTIWRLFPNLGIRQSLWILGVCFLFFLGLRFSSFLEFLRKYKYIWLISGLILTALTVIFGANPTGNGPTLWLKLFNVHVQPSEFLKLILIVYLAGFFADRIAVAEGKLETLLPNLLVTGVAIILLIFQRDLGTASIFLLIYLAMLFTTRGNSLFLWSSPVLILIAGVFGYFYLDVVRLRLDTWLQPFGDPTGASYQIVQSIIAIAEGRLFGSGPGFGSPSLVPVSVSDFIYSAIAEELGFLGVTTLVLAYIFLIYRGVKIAHQTTNGFYRYLSLGLVFYFGIQSILIIGGNIGLLPLTGVTLPFVSYGGSSMAVSASAILILLLISDQKDTPEAPTIPTPRSLLVSRILIAILILEITVTSLISFWFSPALIERAENPRWIVADRFRPRGDILDRDNRPLITTTGESGNYSRQSNHIPLYPILGYTNATYGQTGIEASMYPYLRGYEGYSFQKLFLDDLLYNLPPDGLDVRLTLDLHLQETVDSLLLEALNQGAPGTAILMNADTGEILAMASHPYFDAANLETDWEDLITDENSPLLNRATQGLYPPGATLAPFLATLQLDLIRQNPDIPSAFPGSLDNPECAQVIEGDITWASLITSGCESILSVMVQSSEADSFLTLYEDLGFFVEPNLRLNVAQAVLPLSAEGTGEEILIDDIKISPLQMVMAASALTNGGNLPGPRLVNAYQSPEGDWVTMVKLSQNTRVLDIQQANEVSAMLSESSELPIWHVTATTSTEDDQPITWFVAGTSQAWDAQPTAIVVVLEAKAPALAKQIGISLLEAALPFNSQNPQ